MKMTRRSLITRAIPAVAAGVSFPYVARSAFAGAAQHTLKMVYPDTPTHPFMKVAQRFAENVKKKSEGAVEIQVFTTGQLGSQVNMLTGLQTGIIDLCAHTSGFLQTLYPQFMVVDLPFLFDNSAVAERLLDGPMGPKLLSELPRKGIYGLSYGHFGWRVVSSVNTAAPTPDKMKGLKIRVQPGAIFSAMFTALDANPVQVDLSEVYLALSQGAIGAVETPMISVAASKHDEVVKVINKTNHVYNPGIMMASKRRMDSLAPKYQEAIRQASLEMTSDWRTTIATASDAVEESFKAKGLLIQSVDRNAYRRALQPVYDQFRGVIGSRLMDEVLAQAS